MMSNRLLASLRKHTLTRYNGSTRRVQSSRSSSSGNKVAEGGNRMAYLRNANEQMQKYHETRELTRQGKLKPHPNNVKPEESSDVTAIQAGILVFFLGAFFATPFIGKKIAHDHEFRQKYIPAWYDFTIPRPENPWTRQEIHEQMVAVEKHLMERAAQNEFTDEKLNNLKLSMQDERERAWDRVHPGVADDEDVNDE
jgi:hypothetical protein